MHLSGPVLNGWIVLDKPLGLTSAQAVTRIKRALGPIAPRKGPGRLKIGHGGTLDPLASGVLPIALGEATKLTGRMLNADKSYRFAVTFGEARSSDDAEGAVVETSPVRPARAALEAAARDMLGEIEQMPPAYSALKVDGQRAYALARAGADVALAPRRITIHALRLTEAAESGAGVETAYFRVSCSKGTYVRAIARDLARACGTVGFVSRLRRTRAGPFGLEAAISLDKCQALLQEHRPEQVLLPVTAGLDDIPAIAVEAADARRLRQGQYVSGASAKPGTYRAMSLNARGEPVLVALVTAAPAGDGGVRLLVERGFNLMDEE